GQASAKLGVMNANKHSNQVQPVSPKKDQDQADAHNDVNQAEPLDATVTVLETDRSVNTDPEDGSFSLTHPTGEFTVKAEAYGYHADEQSVTLEDGETTEAHFTLTEEDQGTVEGTITNEKTGDVIADATVLLKEDANIEPVKS